MKLIKCLCSIVFVVFNISFAQTEQLLNDTNNVSVEKIYVSSGTGFFVSEDGHIITSYHIVEDAKSICIEVNIGDSVTEYKANVIAEDIENDLVVLKIDFCG